MAANPQLTSEEARAILTMSVMPEWASFKEYISRLLQNEVDRCLIVKEDHRYYQGKSEILAKIDCIEDKAKNNLGGQ